MNDTDIISLHDPIFNILIPTDMWRGYAKPSLRKTTLGSACYEHNAINPYTDWFGKHAETGSLRRSLGHRLEMTEPEPSLGPFQAYPTFVARALTNPQLPQWMLHPNNIVADSLAQTTVSNLGLRCYRSPTPTMLPEAPPRIIFPEFHSRESVIRTQLLGGENSPIYRSPALSMAGKIALTLHYISYLNDRNPVIQELEENQKLRVWMDYETGNCHRDHFKFGHFQSAHERTSAGDYIPLRCGTCPHEGQNSIMERLGFQVWNPSTEAMVDDDGEDMVPNP